jgi:aryl-alcohol dehydrogenase-like predicted oxidoreductase
MRLSTDDDRDDARAGATIAAALDAGITVFDTARTYGRDAGDAGHNERLLARALRGYGAEATARIVTKGGMTRAGGAWVPDGRAKAIRADCEASLEALDGLPIDLYVVHAPDPRVPWRTTVRALARIVDERLVRRVGVSNVNRTQLEAALDLAPVAAVQVALSVYDDRAIRGGVVERCADAGITVIAHSPLGGPRRAPRLQREPALVKVAQRVEAAPAEVALAWLLGVSPVVAPIPGARRPETARSSARAATLALEDGDRAALERAFAIGGGVPTRPPRPHAAAEVVVVMGIPGAGKSRVAAEYAGRGYARLNRDERGGSLRDVAGALDESLASGTSRIVLDNTYLTRASRSYVVEAAARHGAVARCVWLDTPLAQAQVNLVERLLDLAGSLPGPEELKELAKREPGVHVPTTQMRTLRELEPPAADEGFAGVERIGFVRAPRTGRQGIFVAAAAVRDRRWQPEDSAAPHLVFEWIPDGTPDALADVAARLRGEVAGPVEAALCPHGGGPPRCWCRPPLPGLPLAFARAHGVDPARSTVVGTSTAHQTLAATLGARDVAA